MRVEDTQRVVVPAAGQTLGVVPDLKLPVEGITKDDLEVSKDLQEGRSDLGISLVQ
jgi:hypothetical protein